MKNAEGEINASLGAKVFSAAKWIANRLYPLLVVVWINGFVLRISVRDSAELLAPLYYATPWPVLSALTLPFVWIYRRNPKGVFATIMLTHLFFAAWLMEGWKPATVSKEPADLRVVHWNVQRPAGSLPAIAKRLREYDADIIGVSEPVPRRGKGSDAKAEEIRESWAREFPGYSVEFTNESMLLLVRGKIQPSEKNALADGSMFSSYDVEVKGRAIRVIQVDVTARPNRPRRPALTRLAEIVKESGEGLVIVLGDFNTPRDSVHFAPLRSQLVNTFEKSGKGCGDTWPSFLPVLSLDQIWCGRGLKPVRCSHGVTFRSDHRPVLAELAFEG